MPTDPRPPAAPSAGHIALIAFVVVSAVVAVGWWSPAAAHTEVLRASPSPGEVVGSVDAVELTFLDPVQPGVTIEVVDSLGDSVAGLDAVRTSDDGRRAEVSFPPLTDPGDYVVEYTFTAEDGDTQRETYRFTVVAAGDGDRDGGDDEATTSTSSVPESPEIIPEPNSGTAPEDPGDPGGWLQTALFLLIVVGVVLIGALIVRESRRARERRGF